MFPFDAYFDKNGLMVRTTQPYPEDGDGCYTARDTALYRFGRAIKFKDNEEQRGREAAKLNQELDMLEDPKRPGWYREHPESTMWWSVSTDFSENSLLCLVIAAGALGLKDAVKRMFKTHLNRYGFYQNGSYSSVSDLSIWLRALKSSGVRGLSITYPLVVLCDLYLLGSLLFSKSQADITMLRLIQAKEIMPTPFSKLIIGTTDWRHVASIMQENHNIKEGSPPLYEQLYSDILGNMQ